MTLGARFSLIAVATLVACTKTSPAANTNDSAGSGASAKSDASVAVFMAYVDAWNKRDTVAVDSLLAPGGVHDDLSWGLHAVGPAQVNAFMRDVIKMEPDYKWSVTSTFTDGPHVAAEWKWTATYSGPGPTGMVKNVPTSGRGASIVEVENGKIKQFTDYYDAASFFPKDSARK